MKQRSFPFGEYLLPSYTHGTPSQIAQVGEHLVYTVGEELKHLLEAGIFKKTDIVGVRPAPNWDFIKDGKRRTAGQWLATADKYRAEMDTAVKAASNEGKVLIVGGSNEQGLGDYIKAYGEFEAERTSLLRVRYGEHVMAGVGSVSFGFIDRAWWEAFWNDDLDVWAQKGAVVFQENMYYHWWPLLLVGDYQAGSAWPGGKPIKEWPSADDVAGWSVSREDPVQAHMAGRIYWWLRNVLPDYVPIIHPEVGSDHISPGDAQKYGVPVRDDGDPYAGINSLRKGLEKHAGASEGEKAIVNRFMPLLAALLSHYPQDYGGAWFATGEGAEKDWTEYNIQRCKADRLYRTLIQSCPMAERVKIQDWARHVLSDSQDPEEEEPVVVDPPTPEPTPPNNDQLQAYLTMLEARAAALEVQANALRAEAQAIRVYLESVKED